MDRKTQALDPACLTHELRAPVTSLRLGLQLLNEQAKSRLSPQERQMLDLAIRSAGRLENLVDDVMDYSKASHSGIKINWQLCDVRNLIGEAVLGLQSFALAHGVRLNRDCPVPLPRIEADSQRVVQVLTNLISNAVKFTPPRGTVTVSADMGRFEHEGTIVFKVKDTGKGIPQDELEKIFKPFVQASHTDAGQGTGLGLSLSKMMVELHGGRIWAESWPGLGATFYFTIPISASETVRKMTPYPKAVEYSGLLMSLTRRLNAFLAFFI